MAIQISSPEQVKELAKFLGRMNNQPENHVGFCGEQENEIENTLLNDFSELGLDQSFAIAYQENQIVGAIGMDIDIEDQSAEVWGPFIDGNDPNLLNKLWKEVRKKVTVPVRTYHFFLNERNEKGREFVLSNGGFQKGNHVILTVNRIEFNSAIEVNVIPYHRDYESAFSDIHERTFPNTYYSSEEIIHKITNMNQLFLLPDGENGIKGYVYVEVNPEHHEGSIEFIAVSDSHRKQGIGKQLVHAALSHLFSYPEIEEITLSVGKDNEVAVRLYQASGFKVKHNLTHFVIER